MLTKEQKGKIGAISRKYDLKILLLFGSRVSGRIKLDSDFDLAYSARKPLSREQKIGLNYDLMELFDTDRIDQVDLNNAGPLLLYEISKKSQLLFGSEVDYIKFKTSAFRIFIDSASLFRLQDVLIKKRQQFLRERIYG